MFQLMLRLVFGHMLTVTCMASRLSNISIEIPMRDGVSLFSILFLPDIAADQRVGTVMMRTPYGTDVLVESAVAIASLGWAVIVSDERGRFRSGGEYTFERSAANDTYDAVQFVTSQKFSNGRVAWMGTSAEATMGYVSALAIPGPPTAMSSQFNLVGTDRLREFVYQGGAYREAMITGWLTAQGELPTIAVVQAHEAWDDYWRPTTQSFEDRWALTNWPVLHVAGWYDVFSTIQIDDALALDAYGGAQAQGRQFLIIEPGGHCAGGAIAWPNATYGRNLANQVAVVMFTDTIGAPSTGDSALIERLRTKITTLKSRLHRTRDHDVGSSRLTQMYMPGNRVNSKATSSVVFYVLGSGVPGDLGNVWAGGPLSMLFANVTTLKLYLAHGGALVPSPPLGNTSTAWVADPNQAIPTVGGNEDTLALCGPQDQQAVEAQYANNMARFVGDPLLAPVVVVGVIIAQLCVTSTAVDTDIAVKLMDVFPTGEKMLVQDGILRMRWREGPFANITAAPLSPGTLYAVNITVGYMSYVFSPRHRIAISVSSYNWPRFSKNLNNGSPVNDTESPAVVATNAVIHGSACPSAVLLPTISLHEYETMLL